MRKMKVIFGLQLQLLGWFYSNKIINFELSHKKAHELGVERP